MNRMEIPNVDVHRACVCYQRDAAANTIVKHELSPREELSLSLSAHCIIFVLGGSVRLFAGNMASDRVLRHDNFVFLPVSTKVRFTALGRNVSLLMVKLDDVAGNIPECDTFRLQRDAKPEAQGNSEIYPLKANERIRHFLDGAMQTTDDGLLCKSYMRLLVGQLLFMVQVYYTQDEYSRFYATLLSPDVQFSDFVLKHWRKYPAVTDLADALSITPQQLVSRFRGVFGTTPKVWFLSRRTEDVYYDICSSYKSLKTIAQEYGLSMPNFIRFCRSRFGESPGAIRKRLDVSLGCASGANRAKGGNGAKGAKGAACGSGITAAADAVTT